MLIKLIFLFSFPRIQRDTTGVSDYWYFKNVIFIFLDIIETTFIEMCVKCQLHYFKYNLSYERWDDKMTNLNTNIIYILNHSSPGWHIISLAFINFCHVWHMRLKTSHTTRWIMYLLCQQQKNTALLYCTILENIVNLLHHIF